MAPEQPTWLKLVLRLERAIGVPVESAVRSDAYFDFVTQANRARARLTQALEGRSQEWMHAFNLPTAADVRSLREQLARVERGLTGIAKDVEAREETSTSAANPAE